MKRKKFLNGLIIFGILLFVFMAISPATNAQTAYFGPYGPYFIPPLNYAYAFNPFLLPPFPAPFLATYRNAAVFTPTLPALTTTAPAVTPAGLSITTLIPPPPIGTITFTIPIATLATPASIIVPTLVAPTLIAPTVIAPTLLAAPLAATVVPGITTAIVNAYSPSSGGSWALLASLGILI